MKDHKPTTPGRRHKHSTSASDHITESTPQKSLTKGKQSKGGRNSHGRMTARHQGGGHKRRHRFVDFNYNKKDVPATIESIEYDPNRSAFIALLLFADGERRYVVAPDELEVGDEIIVSESADIETGNRLPLASVTVGTKLHNVELNPGAGARLARSAGSSVELQAKDGDYANLKLPSGEVRKVPIDCWASVGQVSNPEHGLEVLGKAGANRWRGKRPYVRGKVMNPVDHPHGGGEAHRTRSTRRAKTKWGKSVGKGQKTRRPNKYSDKLIIKRRND